MIAPGARRARSAAALRVAMACGAVAVVAGAPISRSVAASAPPAGQVILQGEGSWDPIGEMTTWQNDLFGTSGAINLDYVATGGFSGRKDYLAGGLDYVISGVPFTPAELATLPGGANDLIDAPVQVSALGVMVARPSIDLEHPGFGDFRQVCDPDNPPDPLPAGVDPECASFTPYTGPVRVPAANLSAMLLNYPGGRPQLRHWDNPDVLRAFGATVAFPTDFDGGSDDVWIPEEGAPLALLRSDPSETDYYAQAYAAAAAPAVWQAIQLHPAPGITEQLAAGIGLQTRPGVSEQTAAFENAGAGGINNPGVVIAVPPWDLSVEQADVPKVAAEWVQVQNAAGDWVAPTPASIDAAVDAGGNAAMYALQNQVSGAYPIVWVDHLYAPAHGLPVDKIEALATTIRYLATAGQAATAPVGDGRLPPALVDQALAAANQLVVSNCTGAGDTVTTSTDPGPLAPPLKALQAIGPMLHCIATPAPTATTAPTTIAAAATATMVVGATSEGASANQAVASGVAGDLPPAAVVPPGVSPPARPLSSPPRAAINNAIKLAKLPLPVPGTGTGEFDRFTAFIVGALLILLARKPARWLIKLLQP